MANNKMTASQIKKMKDIINDPIKWAQAFIRIYDASKKQDTPWIARWYQGEALRDKSLRKVLRQGRRTGKCLPGWVKILDPTTGKLNTVEEIYNNKKCNLVTMNKDYKLEKHKTNIIFKNGIKKVYRIKLESGREIDATDNHPLYSRCGWTEIKKLIPVLLQAMAYSNPSGKQNTFAGQVFPELVMVECKKDKIPLSYVNAFEEPVSVWGNKPKVVTRSIYKLLEYVNCMDDAYELPIIHRVCFATNYMKKEEFKKEELKKGVWVKKFSELTEMCAGWLKE